MEKIRIAVVGVGNCASSLIQGISYYRDTKQNDATGLMHWDLGGYLPSDITIAAAFDIDRRKVGQDVADAIFELPNNTAVFYRNVEKTGTVVNMGKILDGFSSHMSEHDERYSFVPAEVPEPDRDDIVRILKESGAEIMVNYLPVGSEQAVRFYAECALDAGMALLNCMPVFLASDASWAQRFKDKNIPVIGDDIKAQLGATITHRVLTDLFRKRGVKLDKTYQLNTGGNTDFLNMLNRKRLASKKVSKTEAVQSVSGARLDDETFI